MPASASPVRRRVGAPSSLVVLGIAVITGAGFGCNPASPSSPPSEAGRGRGGSPDAAASSTVTTALEGGPVSVDDVASCTADTDCRTWSSYCQEAPCGCRVLAKSAAEPRCLSPGKVSCFVDPCMKKVAACQAGRCVLVLAPTD